LTETRSTKTKIHSCRHLAALVDGSQYLDYNLLIVANIRGS